MIAMNKMMEKTMEKPAHHKWLACQCIMLDRINAVKTSSSFGHLPQPPQPPPPPPPQCKKRPRPAEGPPHAPITKVGKTQHAGGTMDEMVDAGVEETEDKEAAASEQKKAKEAEVVVKEKEMMKEKESDHGESLMQDDPKVLEVNLVKC